MLYAILCYNSQEVVGSWSAEEDAAVMARLDAVQGKLAASGRLGPVARLMPTTRASTVRKGRENLVLDGPYAETKEQLLGFYIADFETQEEAVQFARELSEANRGTGGYEIRPVALFRPGTAPS